MPPRIRLFYSALTLALLFIPAVALYSELARRSDIWWTPPAMASTLGDSRDRVEIDVGDKPLAARLTAQQLWIREDAGSRAVSADEIRLRFNNWDRTRVARLPRLLVYAATLGGGLVIFLVVATGRLAYRGERPVPLVTAVLALAAGSAVSQEPLTPAPTCHVRGSRQWLATRPSPLDSVVVTVRGATAKICYSRPSARGRSVDSLVPPGPAWRMGANEPTTITVANRLDVGGAFLGTGRYVILAVPGLDRWTLAFYTTPDTEPEKMFQNLKQVATGTGEVVRVVEPVEQFTIRSESDSSTLSLLLEWGTWRVRVPVRPLL